MSETETGPAPVLKADEFGAKDWHHNVVRNLRDIWDRDGRDIAKLTLTDEEIFNVWKEYYAVSVTPEDVVEFGLDNLTENDGAVIMGMVIANDEKIEAGNNDG